MYFEANGKFYFENSKILFRNDITRKSFLIEGESVINLIKILPYLTGTIHHNSLLDIMLTYNCSNEEVNEILKELEFQQMIISKETSSKRITIISEKLSNNVLKKIAYDEILKDICLIKSIEELSKEDQLILGIDFDNNEPFFSRLSVAARSNNIPWIRIALDEPYIYLGPVFFSDGGACFECLKKRMDLNQNKQNEKALIPSYGEILDVLKGLITRQILLFFDNNNPTNLFGKEVIFNTITLETSSYQVYALPGCPVCSSKIEVEI